MLKATAKPSHYSSMQNTSSYVRIPKIPRWVDCDANEFIRMLNAGELEPCGDAEWARICRLLHMEPSNVATV